MKIDLRPTSNSSKISAMIIVTFLALLCVSFSDMFNMGVIAENDPTQPPDGGTAVVDGDWIITDVRQYSNCTIIVNGNLTIENGGTLTLNDITLKINSITENINHGMYTIKINSGGSLFISSTTITAYNPFYSYRFDTFGEFGAHNSVITYAEGITAFSSIVTISNTNISYARRYGISLVNSNLVLVDSWIGNLGNYAIDGASAVSSYISTVSIANSTLIGGDGGTNPLLAFPAPGGRGGQGFIGQQSIFVRIANSTLIGGNGGRATQNVESFPGPGGSGIYLEWSSQANIINSTLKGGLGGFGYDHNSFGSNGVGGYGILSSMSISRVMNSTIQINTCQSCSYSQNSSSIKAVYNSHVTLVNTSFDKNGVHIYGTSTLTVQWYLRVRALSLANQPIEGAVLRIRDNPNGTFDQNYSTDIDGHTEWIVLTEYTKNSSAEVMYTPHNTTLTKRDRRNHTEILMHENKDIELALGFLVLDFSDPIIIHDPVRKACIGQNIEVNATIIDDTTNKVLLYYRKGGEPNYSVVEMVSMNGDNYSGIIPPQAQEGIIYYYIWAGDVNGNSNSSLIRNPFPIFITEAPVQTSTPLPKDDSGVVAIFILELFAFLLIIDNYLQRRINQKKEESS